MLSSAGSCEVFSPWDKWKTPFTSGESLPGLLSSHALLQHLLHNVAKWTGHLNAAADTAQHSRNLVRV